MTTDVIIRPHRVKRVSAGSLVRVPYNSVDDQLAALTLTGLRYRVDNLTDGLVIVDWTSVSTPGARGTITITGALNAMSRNWRRRQLNKVTLEQTSADGVEQIEFFYELSAVLVAATA